MVEILIDSLNDVIKVIPLLFVIFLCVDFITLKLNKDNKLVDRLSKYDCLGGSLLGIIPQCGISVAFANLYSSGYITLGMLMAVFLAGSDEALIIIGIHPEKLGLVGGLILLKIAVAVIAGYSINALVKEKRNRIKGCAADCNCPRCRRSKNMLLNSALHTLQISAFLAVTVFLLNLGLERVGEEGLHLLLGRNTFMQPVYAAFIGAIPSCMSSVVLAEAYMKGAIGFGALMSGLLANTGYGILILIKDLDKKRLIRVVSLLFFISIFVGEVIYFIGG